MLFLFSLQSFISFKFLFLCIIKSLRLSLTQFYRSYTGDQLLGRKNSRFSYQNTEQGPQHSFPPHLFFLRYILYGLCPTGLFHSNVIFYISSKKYFLSLRHKTLNFSQHSSKFLFFFFFTHSLRGASAQDFDYLLQVQFDAHNSIFSPLHSHKLDIKFF